MRISVWHNALIVHVMYYFSYTKVEDRNNNKQLRYFLPIYF